MIVMIEILLIYHNLLTRVDNIFFTTMSNIQNPKSSRSFIIQTPTTYELEVLDNTSSSIEAYNNDLLVIPDNNSNIIECSSEAISNNKRKASNDEHEEDMSKKTRVWGRGETLALLATMRGYYKALHNTRHTNDKGKIWLSIFNEFKIEMGGETDRTDKALKRR